MTRVLLCDRYPTTFSETYIATEMAWMRRHDVEVKLWTERLRHAPGPADAVSAPGTLAEAVAEFKPHVLHFCAHMSPTDVEPFANKLLETGVPVTIRGHSIGFSVDHYRRLRDVERIWLFPHHAAQIEQRNVESLSVSYDSALYYPATPGSGVIRAGAAKAGKDLEGFLRVAKLCPNVNFTLAVTGPDNDYLHELASQASKNVVLHRHVSPATAAALVRQAQVCLRGHDVHGHPYGMPISIAEALGAGLPIVARAGGPEGYVADAGMFYRTDEEAAALVSAIVSWPVERWLEARARSLARAQRFNADLVLPRILYVWRHLTP